VAGKGSPAALLMALFLAMLRVLLDEVTDLVPLTRRLNSHIIRQAPGTRYITLFIATYDPGTGRVDYVNAGHPPPLVRRLDGTFERLRDGGGVALGMFDGADYSSGSAVLHPGELLSVYSDGVTEAEHPARGFFDEAGLEQSITRTVALSAKGICDGVLSDVQSHVDDGKFGDDLTLLVLRRPV
jgi:sigma-B regulation protein RsbU (phosphoserine phosphatase)